MNWIIVAIVLLMAHKEYMASPTPLKLPGHTQRLTPYIKYWEAANFDRDHLQDAHQQHIAQKRQRRKRDLNAGEYGPAHTIRLNFFAHDKEFRLVLRQDPLSVFAGDVEIENTLGPMDYDISRIYTGSLEDDENSHVHAILTSDNLLDGTIETSAEQYYVEPAHRYSRQLPAAGVHSIVYKVSDVRMQKRATGTATAPSMSSAAEHCASERLRRSMLLDDLKRRKYERGGAGTGAGAGAGGAARHADAAASGADDGDGNGDSDSDSGRLNGTAAPLKRRRRWLPDELSATSSGSEQQHDPPLPLDLDVPYNDDFSTYVGSHEAHDRPATPPPATTKGSEEREREREQLRRAQPASVITWRNAANAGGAGVGAAVVGFTPSSSSGGGSTTKSVAPRNRNIIVNNYSPSGESGNSNNYSNNLSNNYSNNFSNNFNNNVRKAYTKHKNIIVSTYNNNNNANNNNAIGGNNRTRSFNTNSNGNNYNNNNNNNNDENISVGGGADGSSFFGNVNWTTMFAGNTNTNTNTNDRPSHKTHVEIITKNGATKRPNIIVNNYNPEIMVAPVHPGQQHPAAAPPVASAPATPTAPNYNSMLMMTNLLSGRGQDHADAANGMGAGSGRSLYDRKITCMLYLQADHTFFQKMGSDEASIEAITRHVQRANSIYKNTDFNNDGKPDNITFMIKRIKVHNMNAIKDPSYRFPGNYGVEKFLELFSEEDYDAFCLAYMFTYRDFEMGTLGLAWTGDLKNAGGVCEKNGHYRGSLKSLNTGIVTLLNYGKHVPPAVSHVTLAHEIGHNFGSPHDPEQCTPGGEDGNYIMFARATSGDKKNNNKFSPCSLKSIEPVLNAKARSGKGCFTEPQTSICGNGVVEPGEQCDCGWEEDCKDTCCFPMSRHARIDEQPCTLTPRASCSPSQGPCCTGDCKLKYGDKCRDDNGCRDPSFCDGRAPQCPPSVNKPNKTICNKEFVCYMGDCTGSICLAYGLESCQCIPGPQDDKIKSCELCCKLPGEDNACRSSFEWNEPPFDVPDMYAKPGTPCNDYNGYCDVFQKCREVDPSGPLATLRKLLLSEESIATFKKWMQQNWYSVALAALGVLLLLVLSTKLLAKRSNLKLKSVTIIHSATTETVRLPEDNNGVIVHTAVRTKVPFKKKVRGERAAASATGIVAGGKSANNNNNISGSGNGSKGKALHTRGTKVAASGGDPKKPARTKKNRVAGSAATTAEKAAKKSKSKFKKHVAAGGGGGGKEIIDYSARNGAALAAVAGAPAAAGATVPTSTAAAGSGASGTHTNTFGKVQRWLLESPIVAQPLSHIEHSSRVRKAMSKSQSTPERLVQKSPQKTKSMGNLASEKVKLQVVYKPPFKFSLRLSKQAKVKTHVVAGGAGVALGGGAVAKMKRQSSRTAGANESKRLGGGRAANGDGSRRSSGGGGLGGSGGGGIEKTKRAALLLRRSNNNEEEDNQILTLNEPNYETLNPKTAPSKLENPFYENMQYTQVSGGGGVPEAPKMSRSASKTNVGEAAAAVALAGARPAGHSYSRSNSVSSNNPFAAATPASRGARKLSETNSANLSRNFGSTQNLIQSSSSHGNLAKSKKRSSLNLKSSMPAKGGKEPTSNSAGLQTKRSSSNLNLRRDSSGTSLLPQETPPSTAQRRSSHTPPTGAAHSTSTATSAGHGATAAALSTAAIQAHAPRANRSSFSNIPRVSLSNNSNNNNNSNTNSSTASNHTPANSNGFSFSRPSPPAAIAPPAPATRSGPPLEHRRSRSNAQQQPPPTAAAPPTTSNSNSTAQHQRSNSIRQLPHNHHPPPPPPLLLAPQSIEAERELPSDMEVTVSDVENLVSS